MSTFLTKKREQFHSKIRSEYIQNYMMKIRYELLEQQTNIYIEELNRLIEETSCQINEEQLRRLLKYAYEDDENNAIIHVGNLLIDNVISMDGLLNSFGLISLEMKESRYWLWLVKIVVTLINNEDCHNSRDDNNNNNDHLYRKWQEQSINYVLNKFISVQEVFSIIECLEILKLLTGNNKKHQLQHHKLFTQSLLINHPSTIIKLKDHCLHGDKKISELSYETIDQIIEIGDEYTIELIKICSLPEIERILISGFNKLDHSQKKFPLIVCRIINNIYSSNINMSRNAISSCIQSCLNPNNTERVRVEFSYLWLSFCETCSYECLMNALEEKVLRVFEYLIYSGNSSCGNMSNCVEKSNNENPHSNNNNNKFVKIVNNVYCALVRMEEKVREMNNHNNHNEYLHVASSSIKLLLTECESILSIKYLEETSGNKQTAKNIQNLSYYGGNTEKQEQMISSVSNQEGLINEETVTESVSYESSMDLE